MKAHELTERLRREAIVFDGAIGTEIYRRNFFINTSFEQLSLTAPQVIRGIHQAYLDAGAMVMTTNTYSGNRLKLSRFGLTIDLRECFSHVRYYGKGPYENLPDFCAQSVMGVFDSTVHQLCENYIKPQENGMHTGTKALSLTDADGDGIAILSAGTPFTFSARPYTNENLRAAKHREDLHDAKLTNLNIDGFVRGTGTASCGPDVLSQYDLKIKDKLSFSFYLQPVKSGVDKNENL